MGRQRRRAGFQKLAVQSSPRLSARKRTSRTRAQGGERTLSQGSAAASMSVRLDSGCVAVYRDAIEC